MLASHVNDSKDLRERAAEMRASFKELKGDESGHHAAAPLRGAGFICAIACNTATPYCRRRPISDDAGDGANCFCALFKEQLIYEQSAVRTVREPAAGSANH